VSPGRLLGAGFAAYGAFMVCFVIASVASLSWSWTDPLAVLALLLLVAEYGLFLAAGAVGIYRWRCGR
jgi:hypothetical protein